MRPIRVMGAMRPTWVIRAIRLIRAIRVVRGIRANRPIRGTSAIRAIRAIGPIRVIRVIRATNQDESYENLVFSRLYSKVCRQSGLFGLLGLLVDKGRIRAIRASRPVVS